MYMWRRPFLYIFFSSSVGILGGYFFFSLGALYSFIFILSVSVIFMILFLKTRFHIFFLFFLSMLISMWIVYPNFHELRILKGMEDRKMGLTGRIVSLKGEKLVLDKVRVHILGDETGKWIVLRNKVSLKLSTRYLGEKYLKVGSWVFSEGYLRITKYYPFLNFKSSFGKTSIVPYEDSILTMLLHWMGDMRRNYEDYLKEFESGDTVSEIFLGNIPKGERKDLLVRSGIYHFFVVSGMHVGMFSTLVFSIFLFLFKRRRIAISLTILFTLMYSSMIGFSLPAVRACVIIISFLFLKLLDYKQDQFNILGFSGLVLLVLDPVSILSWSFHLSFTAAGAYMYVSSIIREKRGYITKFVLPTSLSTLLILPLIILYFGIIPLFSIPLSLILSPVVFPYVILLSSLSFITFTLKLHLVSSILLYALQPIVDFLRLILKLISVVPYHFIEVENIYLRVLLFSMISFVMIMSFLILSRKTKIF